MQALISTNELRKYGYRVAQVEQDDKTFPVAPRLFWFPCADDVVANKYFYDPGTSTIIKIEEE
jgi:hypothetical protein